MSPANYNNASNSYAYSLSRVSDALADKNLLSAAALPLQNSVLNSPSTKEIPRLHTQVIESLKEIKKELVDTKDQITSTLVREQGAVRKVIASLRTKSIQVSQSTQSAATPDLKSIASKVQNTNTADAIITPISRAATIESAMADLTKSGDLRYSSSLKTPMDEAEFLSGLKDLSIKVNLPPEQLIQVAANSRRGGVEDQDLLAFTTTAAKSAVALEMPSAQDAANTMNTWRASMDLNLAQINQLADEVNSVGYGLGVKTQDLANILSDQGALAQKAGLETKETVAVAGALLSGGATDKQASLAMQSIVTTLTSGKAETTGQENSFDVLKLNPSELAEGMKADATGTISRVLASIAEKPAEQQTALTSQLFGPGADIQKAILPLLNNTQWLEKGLTHAKNSNSSVKNEFEAKRETTEHKAGAAWQAVDRLGAALGDSLLPAINSTADGITALAGVTAKYAEAGGWVTTAITAATSLAAVAAAAFFTIKGGRAVKSLGSKAIALWKGNSTQKRDNQLYSALDNTPTRINRATRAFYRISKALNKATVNAKEFTNASNNTVKKANKATHALHRFNNALNRTASISSGGRGDHRNRSNRHRRRKNSGFNDHRSNTGATNQNNNNNRGVKTNRLNGSLSNSTNPSASNQSHTTSGTNRSATSDLNQRKGDTTAKGRKGSIIRSIAELTVSTVGLMGLSAIFAPEPVLAAVPPTSPSPGNTSNEPTLNNTESETRPSATDSTGGFSDWLMPLGGLAATFIRPINTVMKAGQLTKAVATGKTDKISELAGDVAGGVGGAWAGAAMGATIGSAVPIVGTAIGGLVGATLGGIAGSDGGSWLSNKVSNIFSKESPDEEHKATNRARATTSEKPRLGKKTTLMAGVGVLTGVLSLISGSSDANWFNNLFSGNESGDALKQADQQLIQNKQAQTQQQRQAAPSQQTQQVTISPNITVNAAPGMDAELLAETVLQKINLSFKQALPAFNSSLDGTLDNDMRLTP